MKRIIKGFSLLIAALTLIFICPQNIFALSHKTSYININATNNPIVFDDLSLLNIKFKNYASTSTQAFGITGVVLYTGNKTVNYTSIVYYYNSNYELIAQDSKQGTLISGSTDFNQMSNLSILNGHNIEEINYYSLEFDIDENSKEINTDAITPSKTSQYRSYDYVIDKYDVNIVVNENNTFDITEKITAYFNVAKHGIFRTIPLRNTITRLDGTTSKNRAKLTNLSVNNTYKTSKEDGNYNIKIGSSNSTVTGEQTYIIKYNYNIGKDPVKNYDELYYNIIGTEWDTVIGNVTFTIKMPKDFDLSKLGFSKGVKGSTNNSNVQYNVNENEITGSYNGILMPHEALTVRCELDEGYFVGAGFVFSIIDYILLLIPIVFLGISIFKWYKFGRDERVVETVEFYPPEGFNSLEIGFLYKGEANNQDVTSLLIYLANLGYLKIAETEEKSLFSKTKSFKITKLREYDGNNVNEKIFLDGLFWKNSYMTTLLSKEKDQPEDNINEVTSLDLYDSFYITMNKILKNINNKENKNVIFEKTASKKSKFIILMIILTFLIITIPLETESLLVALLFPGIGFSFMFSMLFGKTQTIYVNGKATNSALGTKLFGLVFGGLFGGFPFARFVLPSLLEDPISLIRYIIGIMCVMGMIIVLNYLPKRTKYGNEILGKIKGFKNFLETVEKDKLESLVMKDPTYFYNILPYTYVLGISDKWIKKFETISMQAPSWYDNPDAFDMVVFGSFLGSTMTSAQRVMSSSPSDSSGGDSSSGGSSGGGSSGGGSGGGGGGSW